MERIRRIHVTVAAIVVVALTLAACGADTGGDGSPTTLPTTTPSTTTPTTLPPTTTTPPTTAAPTIPVPTTPPPTFIKEPAIPDVNALRGNAFVESIGFRIAESLPAQVTLEVSGQLPTPCHALSWEVREDKDGTIVVDVFSWVNAEENCIQVLEPFAAEIGLGDFGIGEHTVVVNDVEATFTV
jgi:hypothetical protein